ncbi:hypothetical protein SAMN05216382_2959 [Sphingomonas palmae]|uniref:Ribose-phosphate pyrophosphokinase n=1 Tax=Sphingomonas palmae TaxID=1855283 RepID=A0A1H7U891_9SPHN|nr:ribose-phosphate pyrophosphokinase [Sphingomonas palmae]SEL92994.1 hypothetical protein SAMN05216382_2959 [Sphingomonas palmae]
MRGASGNGDDLLHWLGAEGIVPVEGPGTIADVALVRGLLVDAAREGRAVSYSELLRMLGHRFTRPKMRALCKTLDAIDLAGESAGEPALAVLVVREGDRLPGQGWWTTLAERRGYRGAWEGGEAERFVAEEQAKAFNYWRGR